MLSRHLTRAIERVINNLGVHGITDGNHTRTSFLAPCCIPVVLRQQAEFVQPDSGLAFRSNRVTVAALNARVKACPLNS